MENFILNLTQHVATPEQISQGVIEPLDKKKVQDLLTFNDLPETDEILIRAKLIADYALTTGLKSAMIGGFLPLMSSLEVALREHGIKPLYSFTKREAVEYIDVESRTITKTSIFKHVGFVSPACAW